MSRGGSAPASCSEKKSAGLVFCVYLVLTGIARFLVEMIRLNPRSFFGMSNAQAASVASVLLGRHPLLLVLSGIRTLRLPNVVTSLPPSSLS